MAVSGDITGVRVSAVQSCMKLAFLILKVLSITSYICPKFSNVGTLSFFSVKYRVICHKNEIK